MFQKDQQNITNQLLDTSDAISVIYTKNPKQAISILAYRVKKAKEKAQQNQLQTIQANNQGSQQEAQMAAQLQAQQKQMDYAHEQEMAKIEAQKEATLLQLKLDSQERVAFHQDQTKLAVSDVTGQAKVVSTEIAGQHQQVKQLIANKKETASAD